MLLTLLGSLLVVSSSVVLAWLLLPLRSRGSASEQIDPETCKARLEEIGSQLKLGRLSEAEADAARLALLSQRRAPSSPFAPNLRGMSGTWVVTAAVFVLVAGIGAAASYFGDAAEATGATSVPASAPDGEVARLADYTRSFGKAAPAPAAAADKLLPDVSTMIERLAARLETAPNDIDGWRMLGWSYFNMERYQEAAAAYAKAMELDPASADLKRWYEEAKAKASGSATPETAAPSQAEAAGKAGDAPGAGTIAASEPVPAGAPDAAAIRSMVDGLAQRLETSPRDVDGWTRLMRSRVVLGETEVAETAMRKALEVFKDDLAASDRIRAAAIELGLKAE